VKFLTWKKHVRVLIPLVISVVFVLLLINAIDWRDAIRIFDPNVSTQSLLLFAGMASVIAWMYGLRWNWLLDNSLSNKTSMVASLLSIGGNMFLPVRGGDLMRVHYSHVTGHVPHAMVLSRLVIEKIVDLITVAIVGVMAVVVLNATSKTPSHHIIGGAIMVLAILAGGIVLVKFGNSFLVRCLGVFFGRIGRLKRIERNLIHLIQDISHKLTVSVTLKPALLTILMWLAAYVPSYILIADMVGVSLNYQQAMLVLFAAALGLMIPAAPSGIGTFHASVVSAFIVLGRSPTEGLLVGTAIHLFFFIAYATPAVFLYGIWFFNREALR
jgi:hypothetical protein